jgi:hypothetical protein
MNFELNKNLKRSSFGMLQIIMSAMSDIGYSLSNKVLTKNLR